MTTQAKRYDIPAQAREMRCRGCAARIVFVESENGKPMPVEAVGPHRGESHFIACPKAKEFKGTGQGNLFGDGGRKA
jgi:hypothetical protein